MSKHRVHSITLRFQGNDLDPTALTDALAGTPTHSGRMSDPGIKTGHWWLKTSWEVGEDLNGEEFGKFSPRILDLLAPLSADLEVWRALSKRFSGGVLCTANIWNRAAVIYLTTPAMSALSERGLHLSFVSRE